MGAGGIGRTRSKSFDFCHHSSPSTINGFKPIGLIISYYTMAQLMGCGMGIVRIIT